MADHMRGGPRTFVLVPGAGGAAWYWHRVVPLLRAAGHAAIAVDLPGDDPQAGLPEYARLVGAAVDGRPDVVLVAQSLGGFTAPMAAAVAPVSAIVLVNAMIPVPGETPGAWWGNTGQAEASAAAAERGGYSTEFDLPTYFLHDVPAEVAAAGEPHQRPEADAFRFCLRFQWLASGPGHGGGRGGRPVLPGGVPATGGARTARSGGRRAARRPPDRPGPTRSPRALPARRLAARGPSAELVRVDR